MIHKVLEEYPRIKLGEFPTPLEKLPRLSQELGRELYVKRDDGIGPGMGGNKTRKLEYILAEVISRRASRVATFGGLQSNHVRLTAAAAAKHGIETHIIYFERKPRRLEGNLMLNQLLGAKMHFIPLGASGRGMSLETTNRLVRLVALALVGRHYFIPVGGHSWLGALGYVRAALEIDEQARGLGIPDAWLVAAAGSGGTLAGLAAGLALIESPLRLVGVDVGKLWKGFPASIAHLSNEVCQRLDSTRSFRPTDIPLIENTYAGERYGLPSPEGMAALRRLARLEGILLDPVYTGKAFGGMLDLCRNGYFSPQDPVIFLHTGGVPAMFAFESTFAQDA